jgi:hypothetical protein
LRGQRGAAGRGGRLAQDLTLRRACR